MFDGSTRFLSEKIDGGVLRLLLGIADSIPSSENGETSGSEPSTENADEETPEAANADAEN
jgi:hypothetical protein